ncbi:MAG: PEP-CTERM sorting domain-containing protein [Phycisphaerales bacterium]
MKMVCAMVAAGLAGSAMAQVDGLNLGAGLPLVATQDTPTGFGNAAGGVQASGGSELNAMWGTISGGTLSLSVSGNIEANFNKVWFFFDAVAGGEQTLAGDNNDGGFNEINNLGFTFDSGFEPDHGMRVEVGGGFLGIRAFDLIDNTGGDVWTAGGPGDLPLVGAAGGFGVTTGWDNSNGAGVTDSDASGALTATTGWEFEIDMAAFFGEVPSSVKVMAIVTSGDGNFASNQVLPGVGGLGNLGGEAAFANRDFNAIAGDQFATIVPAPASAALLGLGGLAAARRRR